MYIIQPVPSCFILLWHIAWRAFSRACAKTGNRIEARIAIMAMTTSSSIRVKAFAFLITDLLRMMQNREPFGPSREGGKRLREGACAAAAVAWMREKSGR